MQSEINAEFRQSAFNQKVTGHLRTAFLLEDSLLPINYSAYKISL